jgi:hypothetical protein
MIPLWQQTGERQDAKKTSCLSLFLGQQEKKKLIKRGAPCESPLFADLAGAKPKAFKFKANLLS